MIKNFLSNLFNSLMPTISRENIETQYKNTIKEIRETTLVTIANMEESMYSGLSNLKTFKAIMKSAGYGDRLPVHKAIEQTLKSLVDSEEKFLDFINSSMRSTILKDVLDHRGLNVISYVIAVRKVSSFVRIWIVAVAAIERQRMGYKLEADEKLAIKHINDKNNVKQFGAFFKVVSMDAKDYIAALQYLQSLQVEGDLTEAQLGVKRGSTDPGKLGFLPYQINPAYYFGLLTNKWVGYQYDTAKLETERYVLIVQALEAEREGALNEEEKARNEKMIKWYSKQISINITKIKRIEEEANE